MYTYVSKCKNDKILRKEKKKQRKHEFSQHNTTFPDTNLQFTIILFTIVFIRNFFSIVIINIILVFFYLCSLFGGTGFELGALSLLSSALALELFSLSAFTFQVESCFCLGLGLSSPTYASCIPGITNVNHHALLIEMGSC
jgi:hypothetical protein